MVPLAQSQSGAESDGAMANRASQGREWHAMSKGRASVNRRWNGIAGTASDRVKSRATTGLESDQRPRQIREMFGKTGKKTAWKNGRESKRHQGKTGRGRAGQDRAGKGRAVQCSAV